MTPDQILAVLILLGTITLLVMDWLRYDLAGLLGLFVAMVAGIVAPEDAFTGFSDDIVIIIGSAFVISAAIARSGVIETAIRPFVPLLRTTGRQVIALAGAVTFLSAFVKNIAALAIFLPVAFQLARRNGTSVSALLMPMAFGALLGGMITLIGTSPNIIVSRVRADILDEPFSMFDFAPVGLGLSLVGLAFLSIGWRLLPRDRKAQRTPEALFSVGDYITEARVPAGSPAVGQTVEAFEAATQGEARIVAIVREQLRRYIPGRDWALLESDILVLQGDPHALQQAIDASRLQLVGAADSAEAEPAAAAGGETAIVEAVITAGSPMIDCTLAQLRLPERYGVQLLAASYHGREITIRLRRAKFRVGDLVVLRGRPEALPDILAELGCLPLAERRLRLGQRRQVVLPLLIVAAVMLLTALQLVPVPVAFFGAAIAMPILGVLTPKESYEAIDWPILILLGSLIPVADALRTTGVTDLIAEWLSGATGSVPATLAVGLLMAAAMGVTPFLNNAATVLVMAPIGAGVAQRLGLSPDPFLMAVAVGAACDFLTPIGHQCNTLVMGPGGYRFGDYWRLGLPLSFLVLVLGTLLITTVWPIR